jgi:hypothetical protein
LCDRDYIELMEKSDFDLVQEIESVITDHLAAIKKEAHERVLKLCDIDRDEAWEQIQSAVDDYGADMLTDATWKLKQKATDYSSQRWRSVTARRGHDG